MPAPNDTPDRIFAAADLLFAERGYDAVSVRDVADAAGVKKALVFYHFGSKDKLFAKVLEGYYAGHRAALAEAYQPNLPPGPRMHQIINAYLDFIMENQHYPKLVQRQVASVGPHMALIDANLQGMLAWTEDALSDIAPKDGPLAARHLFLTFSSAVINYFTYAPAIGDAWSCDPLSAEGIAERRAHLHWLVDTLMAQLERESPTA